MAVETLSYVYTSRAEMERLFTVVGVGSRLEDLIDDDQMLLEFMEEATDWVNQYCALLYLESDLNTSRWVHSRCTWYACHLLSQRAGNPALFIDRIESIEKDLKDVFNQRMMIPRLPTRGNMAPAMSNVVVDDHFDIAKIRVHQTISPGGSSSRQDPAYLPFHGP